MNVSQITELTGAVRLARLVLEGRRMAKQAQGLTKLASLVPILKDSDTQANSLADRLSQAVTGFNSEMGTTLSIVETVESARDALRTINQAMLPGDNNGPPLVSSGSPVSSHPSELASLGTVRGT